MDPTASETARSFARRLAGPVYTPWILAQLGRGMLVPVVPLYLRDAGLSYTMVAVVLAALGLGAVVGGLPAGGVAGRLGPEWLFVAATIATGLTAVLMGVSTAVLALVAFRLLYGMGSVGMRISVQMLVNAAAPVRLRGRGMSFLGGAVRLAFFVGPIAGGVLVDTVGFTATFAVCAAATLSGLLPFLSVRRERPTGARLERPTLPLSGLGSALRRHRGLLLLAGTGSALVMTVREGRNVVVPLIGDDLGLSATAVGALVAIGTGADLALFPVAGWLMDRFGRLYAIVPAFSLLGLGMLVLGLSSTTTGVVIAGVVMGIGNGMSAGTMLTLGGDLAPADAGPFLAALGMMQDAGVVIGPIVVGRLADTAGLYQSAVVLALVMFSAIAYIVVVLGDTARPSRPWLIRRLGTDAGALPAD
ncbi:MAG TPA: MFS transporter [Ilumatobacter sp.]